MISITKNTFLRFLCFTTLSLAIYSCSEDPIPGCMDEDAVNYTDTATEDDGSCIDVVEGCTDTEALNYDVNANTDDGSCCNVGSCLELNFRHMLDQAEIVFGNEEFYATAVNTYSVRRILYVLSDITLYFENNNPMAIDDFIFINTDDISTLKQTINNLPGLCVGISFRFGFSAEDNGDNVYLDVANQFHNNMLWPNSNGVNIANQGGYHYMKLEGKYVDASSNTYTYNTHTGPSHGQDFSIIYSAFNFSPTSSIIINMNANNWYNDPEYDMTIFGNTIMSDLTAQDLLQQNGLDVFSVE